MATVEEKTPAERNKMIAAIVLGAIALISLAYMFLGSSSKSTTTTGAKPSPTPVVSKSPIQPVGKPVEDFIPKEIKWDTSEPPVSEAGRNIFAFYVAPP